MSIKRRYHRRHQILYHPSEMGKMQTKDVTQIFVSLFQCKSFHFASTLLLSLDFDQFLMHFYPFI